MYMCCTCDAADVAYRAHRQSCSRLQEAHERLCASSHRPIFMVIWSTGVVVRSIYIYIYRYVYIYICVCADSITIYIEMRL